MAILARRLTIITLSAAIFAMAFSAAVLHSSRAPARVHIGTAAPCYHPASPSCVAVL
ncbi:hypothetical protein LJR030_001896 [Rhizobium sp. LjRoot30]|uniref:hypothetical protein n=1 Tax=Rhizobium sp. LjRoot30 TaxID=3342320 RepID=UPI003ECFEE6C